MPKKSTTHGGTQRNRPKTQKAFELVRPPSEQQGTPGPEERVEPATYNVSTATEEAPASQRTGTKSTRNPAPKRSTVSEASAQSIASVPSTESAADTAQAHGAVNTAPKGSAAARFAASRQAKQKAQQRAAATLVTAEHYAYVRKDLIFIAILAVIFFSAIIILYFVPGIGS